MALGQVTWIVQPGGGLLASVLSGKFAVVNSGWIFVVSEARDAGMPGVFRGSATKLSAKRRPK